MNVPQNNLQRAILIGMAAGFVAFACIQIIDLFIGRYAAKHGPQLAKESHEYLAVKDATTEFLERFRQYAAGQGGGQGA